MGVTDPKKVGAEFGNPLFVRSEFTRRRTAWARSSASRSAPGPPLRTQVMPILGKFLKWTSKRGSPANLADEFIVQKKGFLVVKDNYVRNICRKEYR
ncbi:hypothetical protein ACFVY1_25940 [Streptomyces sp. NPDC058293]|uniref:hypothetical protein n=1 Tax=Streptomyces sp. NPDC058293 TaxID=3346429 RepID=UPI0036F1676A